MEPSRRSVVRSLIDMAEQEQMTRAFKVVGRRERQRAAAGEAYVLRSCFVRMGFEVTVRRGNTLDRGVLADGLSDVIVGTNEAAFLSKRKPMSNITERVASAMSAVKTRDGKDDLLGNEFPERGRWQRRGA